eukprot:scaffold333_cov133-Cylindrotheca_fusiformis.AAC.14
MPLPIAVGGKSVSAEVLAGVYCREEDSEEGIALVPVELYQTIGWGVCPHNEWLVRVTVGYYDLMDFNKGARDCTMLEVRIQVSYLNKPLSKINFRETVHHLKLIDGARDDYPQFQPQVSVSEDRRNLAVLLFHPHQQSSAVVIFQLRRPRGDLKKEPHNIPMPSYCTPNLANDDQNMNQDDYNESPAVATNPHFASVWGISAICSIPNVSPCVFLAVCNDGSFIWLDARSSASIATGVLAIRPSDLPISSLTVTSEGMERGNVLAVSSASGHCILAQWKLESRTAVQQTKLERNSTGNLVVRPHSKSPRPEKKNPSNNNHNESKSPKKATNQSSPGKANQEDAPRRHRRSSSADQQQQQGFKNNRFWNNRINSNNNNNSTNGTPQNTWKNAFQNKRGSPEKKDPAELQHQKQIAAAEEAKRRKSHMDEFVLKELRKKAITGSWIIHETGRGPNKSLQRRRRRSDVAGQHDDPFKRTMKLEVLSVLEEAVVAARFGSTPTIVCVVYQATSRKPRVAQVYSICEMGTFQPVVPLRLTSEQIEDATNLQATNAIVSDDDWDTKNSINTKFGLDHEPLSDTFAISTAFGDQWVGCLWNWRAHALGWVVKNEANSSLWSRLYIGRHAMQRPQLCYLESVLHGLRIHTRKHLVAAGMLSPPNSYMPGLEPCSLMVASDFIAFPFSSQEMNIGIQELEWKISTLPSPYINAFGPPKLATTGRHNGATIAVASSCGVCILDSKYRWRQFGTPSEEGSFAVVSMAWWEGNGSKKAEENEDFLLAIVQSRTGRQYLSCWSPKRLGMRHQLLKPMETDENKVESQASPLGIPLMKNIKATSLSILAEPHSKNKAVKQSRRAVVFVSSTDTNASEVNYVTFQLQLCKKEENGSEKRSIMILARNVISGILKDGTRSVGPISSVYLAGASFRFDLKNPVGVTRTPGGLEVISLDSANRAWTAPVISADEVSKIWLIDIVHGGNRRLDSFVWAVELLNGDLFCWSVPSLLGSPDGDAEEFHLSWLIKDSKIDRPKGLRPPTLVCKRESRNEKKRFLLGILSHVGTSSNWMQQSSAGCQTDIAMGPVPRSSYGCGLRAGQGSKNVNRAAVGGFSGEEFSTNILNAELFGPGEFLMTPPAFVPSLYSMFVEAAYLRTEVAVIEECKAEESSGVLNEESTRILNIERHIHSRLTTSPNKDAVVMALRLLILRTVEMLAYVHRKDTKEQSDASRSSLLLAMALFSEVVDAVRKCATNLQFASLFLEVGRQVEPSCLVHLFPLPEGRIRMDGSLNRTNAKTVVDLFSLCVQEGSLLASASALPLLGSRLQSRNYCDLLMARSIETFVDNTSSSNCKFDRTEEERRVIGDIFRFGIKLEDAAMFEDKLKTAEEKKESCEPSDVEEHGNEASMRKRSDSDFSNDDNDKSDSSGSDFSDDSSDGNIEPNALCNIDRSNKMMGVFSMFSEKKEEEEAIRRSALNFIGSNGAKPSLDFLNVIEEDNDDKNKSVEKDLKSMGGLVGGALVELLLSPKTDCPWKSMASLSRMLLQETFEVDVSIFSKVAGRIDGDEVDEMIPDLHPDLRAGDAMDRFAEFLVTETGQCGNQINESEANTVLNLALFLLQRLEKFRLPRKQSFVTAGLVTVGLVAACVVGREQELLATLREDCFMSGCYKVTAYDC